MSWQYLILLQAILVAVAMIITRLLARKKQVAGAALVITAGWFVVLFLCGLLMLPLFGDVRIDSLKDYWLRFILGGGAFALANIFMYYMLARVDAAIGSIFGTLNALFTVIGASVLLNEYLTSRQIVGACVLLVSIIYAMFATRHKRTRTVHRRMLAGFGFALLSALFYAIASVNEKSLLEHVSVGDYLAFGWFWQAVMALGAAALVQPKRFKVLQIPGVALWTGALGAIRAVSGLFFILSLVRSNNVGLMTVVSNFRLIVVVLLGTWLLRERQRISQKLLASAAAIAALTLMFWQK